MPKNQDRRSIARVGNYANEDSFDNFQAVQYVPYRVAFYLQKDTTLTATHYKDEYRLTLQNSYEEHVRTTFEWAHERGLEYPNQTFDSITLLDAAESKSLGLNDTHDLCNHLAVLAHMASHTVASSECDAVNGAAYTETIPDLLPTIRRDLVRGISTNAFHGYAYSGVNADTTRSG
ncbi:hypothetical protein CORC01_02972 [Colletotrichum orchidophilum]|uniref:Uncharacterized protein n=1 Tax=Colletotrichum orchidophilum TaxID=1209926 RepID=A0A1G4BK22_9PEZI|nr:uncharacterized protein CORC01_02972 [Colletotrichum orchidophilum]OHF01781.1 hypothetical protein CORC01_02972 [Colletotrichum orchidophilum]